jgi:hypothetical protein
MDGACGMYGEEMLVIWRGNMKERDHLENLKIDNRKLLK